MSQKIGPREQALREMRELRFKKQPQNLSEDVRALKEKVAAVPAQKPKTAKKKRL